MRRIPILVLCLAAGISVAACDIKTSANGSFSFDIAAGKATDTWTRSYKIADKGRFELINVNGRISAEPTDGPEVVVEAQRTAKGSSDEAAKELLAKLEIREEVSDSSVRVESRPPRLSGLSVGHEIEWTIKVPKGVVVDLRTTNGGVRLQRLSNEIHAKTTNGGVKGEDLTSHIVDAKTVNGGVELVFSAPLTADHSVEMESVNGGVSLDLPAESKATIAARCVNGGIKVSELDIKRDDESATDFERRRRLNGTMNGGGARVEMNTTNGGVHLGRATPRKTT